jgi:hypothetical protein
VENIEQLLMDVKESLEREIHGLGREIHGLAGAMREGFAQMNTRFDTQAARLDRHAGLWQTGSRWSAGIDVWAEKIDAAIEVKDREIAELRERLIKLERKSPS